MENNIRHKHFSGRAIMLAASLLWATLLPSVVAETPRINLQNTEIRTLVEAVSKVTGKNFVIDPAVRGNVTFVSGEGLSEDQFYEAFLSILQVHGFEAIDAGNVTKIVPINKARSQVAPIIQGTPEKPAPRVDVDETVTQVFPLQYIPVNTAIQTLQPLAGQGETRIQFNQSSNAVIVTGRGQNVQRLAEVIRQIDVPNNQDFELVALRYSVASQLANTLRGLMASGKTPDGGAVPQRVYISVDERTNSLLVSGDKADRERMRAMIQRLDIPRTQPPSTQVIKLRYADATRMVEVLRQLQVAPAAGGAEGGAAVKQARIAVDAGTNSIIISGDQEDREPIVAAIRSLDVPRTQPVSVQILKLRYADAARMVEVLRQLQITDAKTEGANPVKQARIAVDTGTNSIIVAGDQEDRAPIVATVRSLDVPRTQPLTIQIVRLKHGNARQLVEAMKQLQVAQPTGEGANPVKQARIAVDENTNSIIIAGDQEDRLPVLNAIKQLDIPGNPPDGTDVVPIRYAVATQLLQTLNQLQITEKAQGENATTTQQIRLAADERTNSILISGDKTKRAPIIAAIRRLDIPKNTAGRTRVVALRYASAEELVGVLKETAQGIQKQSAGTTEAAAAGSTPSTASGSGSDISIQADKTTNSLIISAPEHIHVNLQRVISQLDRRRSQVMIEAIIAEVSTNLSNQLGTGIVANGAQNSGVGGVGYSNFGGLNTVLGLMNGATTVPGGFLFGLGGSRFGVVVEALRGDAATNILSTPTLVTMDNEEASIVVGQNVPFITGSYASGSTGSAENPFTTIQRQDVGLTLKVTPQINRDRTIRMKIQQEVSSIAASSSGASDLITNKRTINTNVMVEDGQVLVLGGLIQGDFNDRENKVPVLSDLPIIGGAFRENTTSKNKQNLMAFIHPVILADRLSSDAYSRLKWQTLQRQQQDSNVLKRGSLGQPAQFPSLDCADNNCVNNASVDNLHLPQQAQPPVRRITRPAPAARQQNSSVFTPESGSGR